MPQTTTLAISFFFHLLATVVWIGGLTITTLLVWPEMRRALEGSPALYTLLTRLRQRFTPWSNLSLAVLIVTGLIQMSLSEQYNGLLDFGNTWSRVILMKHIAVGAMAASGVVLQNVVVPALERATLLVERSKGDPEIHKTEWERLRRREIRLTRLNLLLGVAILGFSAWAGAV